MGTETELHQNSKNVRSNLEKPDVVSASEKNGLQKETNSEETTCPYVYYRVIGYTIGAVVHLGNNLAMRLALRGPIMKEPDIEYFYSMQFIYFTIWNLAFQALYIAIGLVCDLPILLKMENNKVYDWLRSYRKIFYTGVLWPSGVLIFVIFWPIFFYDRSLIFPVYIDRVLSQNSNYVMHLFIVFPIIWDLFFLPNVRSKSEKYAIVHCILIWFGYLTVLLEHYNQRKKWPYPIMKLVFGTFYFPLMIIIITVLVVIIYLAQWPLISAIWKKKSKTA